MNENIKLDYDLDYSKDKTIDKRVLEVCAIAEAKFLKNQKKFSGDISDSNNLIINNNNEDAFKIMFSNKDTKKALETNRSYVQNKSYFTASKIGKIDNKSLSLEKNLLSQRYYNQKYQVKSKLNDYKNRLNTQFIRPIINNNENFANTKLYLKKNKKINNENRIFNSISNRPRNFNFKRKMNQQLVHQIK